MTYIFSELTNPALTSLYFDSFDTTLGIKNYTLLSAPPFPSLYSIYSS